MAADTQLTARQIARLIPQLALAAHADDPLWPSYVTAHLNIPALAERFPKLAALAQSDRRDWSARELLRTWLDYDTEAIIAAAMYVLKRDEAAPRAHAEMAAGILACLTWLAAQDPAPAPVKDDPDIPF